MWYRLIFFKIAQALLWFHTKFRIDCSISTKMALEIKWIRAKGSLGRVLIILDSIVYYSLILIQTVNTTSTSLWWPDPRRIQAQVVFPLHFQIKTPLESSNPRTWTANEISHPFHIMKIGGLVVIWQVQPTLFFS